jgi:hypothetical protein
MGSAKTPDFIFRPHPRIWLETPTFSQLTYTYILSAEKVCVSFFQTGLKRPVQPCKAIIKAQREVDVAWFFRADFKQNRQLQAFGDVLCFFLVDH